MKNSIITIIFILYSISTIAQSKKIQKIYAQAKQYLNEKNYSLAIEYFKDVIDSQEENSMVTNAHFFYAQAALKNKELGKSQYGFETILKNYPNWQYKDEVYYSLADIAFKNKEYDVAIDYINQVKSNDLQTSIHNMMGHYIIQMSTLELKLLQQTYPDNTFIAQCLVDKIAATSNKLEDIELMEKIIEELSLETPKKRKVKRKIYKRTPYKIAILLPFEYHKLKNKDTTSLGRLAINLYQGIRLAKKELDSLEGTKIELYAYDINRNNKDSLDKMVLSGEFDDMDFIIGPIFENSFKKMADVAQIKRINIINPISFKSSFSLNDYTFMYTPFSKTQAIQTIKYISTNYVKKSIIIFFDNLSKNKELANTYRQQAEKAGLKVVLFEEVSTRNIAQIKKVLSDVSNDEIGSIFVSSTSQLVASEIIRNLNNLNIKAPVFVPDSWLKFQSIDYEDYERMNTHFISPDYLNKETQKATKFKIAFQEFTRKTPNNYAYIGYEIIHYFSNLLGKYGTNIRFKNILQTQQAKEGKITGGFDYSTGNDNQYVPLLKIKEGETTLVNKIQ